MSSEFDVQHVSPPPDRPRALPGLAAGLLAFFASAAILVLEILGARILAPYVGVTLQTYTAIIGTVLTGISLGTWFGGRLADRHEPHALLGPLLAAGGATVLFTVPSIRFFASGVNHPGSVIVIMLTFAGLFTPAAILSAINPTLVKLQLSDLHSTGSVVGRLSALATAGAIVGTFTTGFLLVSALPTSRILAVMGGCLVTAGIIVHLLLRTRSGNDGQTPQTYTSMMIILIVSLTGFTSTVTDKGVCDKESSYYCIRIIDDPSRQSGRFMQLDDVMHGYSDLNDPTHLEFVYAQQVGAAVDIAAPESTPIRALSIGGGAFTIPRYIAATRPGSENTVFEVDPLVVETAEERLGLVRSASMRVHVGDARTSIRDEKDAQYDFVVGDAFGGEAVPWHLTTKEFLQELRRVMTPDAVYAMNIIDYTDRGFVRAELRTLREVFADVVLVVDAIQATRASGNHVLIASPATIDTDALRSRLEETSSNARVLQGPELDEFIGDAVLLRDDYAPVDQLITPASRVL